MKLHEAYRWTAMIIVIYIYKKITVESTTDLVLA